MNAQHGQSRHNHEILRAEAAGRHDNADATTPFGLFNSSAAVNGYRCGGLRMTKSATDNTLPRSWRSTAASTIASVRLHLVGPEALSTLEPITGDRLSRSVGNKSLPWVIKYLSPPSGRRS
jgi:hypothetical protein